MLTLPINPIELHLVSEHKQNIHLKRNQSAPISFRLISLQIAAKESCLTKNYTTSLFIQNPLTIKFTGFIQCRYLFHVPLCSVANSLSYHIHCETS